MVGAFCYAVLDSEDKTGSDESADHWNASSNWTVLRSEYSDSGYCQFILLPNESFPAGKNAEEGGDDEGGKKVPSYWYQDHSLQQLFTRIDENYVAYVFPTFTFWARIDPITEQTISCYKDGALGYPEFIARLGLYSMVDRHSEIRKITNNRRVYDGEPSAVLLRNDSDVSYFVRAYADYETGVLLGWDTFYGRNSKSKVFHSQCWFDEMLPQKPHSAAWETLPAECL
uniref:Uncharacterized protein n=1 Tax=Panagrolaimus sp. JU765 TaxID=591449 RepID=A0AC34R2K3_9BILA